MDPILEQNNIQHLIFVNDQVTRYVPMAALFDGDRYLIERYAVSSILSAELTDTETRLENPDTSSVLGLGLTQAKAGLNALPAVSEDLNAIVRSDASDSQGIYPGRVY